MEALTARINEAEERISDIEHQMTENKEAEQKRDKQLQDHLGSIPELSDTIRQNNIRITGIPEGEEERAEQKVYWRELLERISLIWQREQASKSRRCREPPSKSIRIGPQPVI